MPKIKKAQNGERTFPTPFKPKKGYKAKIVENTKDGVTSAKVKVRRTIGGFLSGKPRGKDVQIPAYNVPQRNLKFPGPERPPKEPTGNKDVPRRTKNGGKVTKKSISKPINKKSKKK